MSERSLSMNKTIYVHKTTGVEIEYLFIDFRSKVHVNHLEQGKVLYEIMDFVTNYKRKNEYNIQRLYNL